MSFALPKENKFKIYVSALTQLNVDEHNRVPTTDGRLLRRIVRDARTRGTTAKATISMWPSVRRGEESYIFPYQEQADVMFNSALIYELAVLKMYAEPLLFGIGREEPEYQEAKRLLKFLDYFVGIPSESVPMNSILREFIGGRMFSDITKTMEVTNIVFSMAFSFSLTSVKKVLDPFFLVKQIVVLEDLILSEGFIIRGGFIF